MASCADEAVPGDRREEEHHHHHHHHGHHGHHHGHGHQCDHDDHEELERGEEWSLYKQIDTTRVRCLNEAEAESIGQVFKPWSERLDTTRFVESDCDEQLLVTIGFTTDVKIKSICVIGGEDGTAPSKLKAWINREDIDFDLAESLPAVQEWDLQEENRGGRLEYATRYARFSGVSTLVLFFPTNFGAETSKIYYIGLKGEFTNLRREPVVATYEARAMPGDHKVAGEAFSRQVL